MRIQKLFPIALSAVLCTSVAACDDRPESTDAATTAEGTADAGASAAVEKAEQELLAAFKAKDANRLSASYADDATVMLPNQQAVKGRQAISQFTAEMLKDPNFSIDFSNDQTRVASSGDLAYTRGTYTVSYTDPRTKQKTTERGSYVTVLTKQEDGTWKVLEDIVSPGEQSAAG